MKFIFADSLDYVDPRYDFLDDRSPSDREPYWDDHFPHELLGYAPYDGILVSRAIVGGSQFSQNKKYSDPQTMRFRRVGAREFLRFREADFPGSVVFGDSGAFSYHKMEEPPYTAEDMVDFYGDGQFTHGCSVDHIIFDFLDLDSLQENAYASSEEASENKARFEITLANAEDFLKRSKRLGNSFTPLGVVQGWSPFSMAEAASRLVKMGYTYLAVGGMAPLRSPQIHKALDAIREAIPAETRIHVLGFAKADEFSEFRRHRITSFDTTSPLIRAFKDARNNYYLPGKGGRLEYYSAIRIPQALENNTIKNLVKEGVYRQEDLQNRERRALDALRSYDRLECPLEDALTAVMDYTAPIAIGRDEGHSSKEKAKLSTIRERAMHTLQYRPWTKCDCAVCKNASIDVIIFRASNRNKRRGIHNLAVYGNHIQGLELGELEAYGENGNFPRNQSAAECEP